MNRPSESNPFYFPEILAAHTMLTRVPGIGIQPEDIYYIIAVDALTRAVCMGIEIRPRGEGRDVKDWQGKKVTLSLEEIDFKIVKDEKDAFNYLAKDSEAWNKTDQDYRERFMHSSRIWSRKIELIALLSLKGVHPKR